MTMTASAVCVALLSILSVVYAQPAVDGLYNQPPQPPIPPVMLAGANAISGLHVLKWFTAGGGMCQAGMSVADCSYRRLLMRHIKTSLQMCSNPLTPSTYSTSHRGAPQIFPEHTQEGYLRAIQDGAGNVECDVAVTKDFQLVCRHDQCDLASTTNVLSLPLAAKCTVPGKRCCTYDFTFAEFNTLCGKSYSASGPHNQAYTWNASTPNICLAHPGNLQTMCTSVVAAGRNCIPEQKNCDLMCQAKLAAANNMPASAVVNAITDKIVTTLATITGGDPTRSILQTFELQNALYVNGKYTQSTAPGVYRQQVTFLYEYHGQGVQTNQADYYLGSYPAGFTNITNMATGVTSPSPAMGSATCAWCVNGTSPGGWYDVMKAAAAGVQFLSPSTADLVRPQGSLLVASDWAKWVVGNYSNVKWIGWTLERSTAIYGTSPAAPSNWPSGSYSVFDSVGWAYQEMAGVATLDHEDILLMLYALRWDVPNFNSVFSDYPGSTTAFMNCVPKFEAQMPVSSQKGWANPAVPYTAVTRATGSSALAAWQLPGYANTNVALDGTHLWRMFSGGGGLCGVAQQDEYFYDYDVVPPSLVGWGANVSYAGAPNFNMMSGGNSGNGNSFIAQAPNKPFPAAVTTSPQDCSYRRKLMNWIKSSLSTCGTSPTFPSIPSVNVLAANNFSISHRGSPITFPEHTLQGYRAAATYGANFIECDVAASKDLVPVCRHSQCDLHTTTNVLFQPSLASKCSVPFTPATFNADGSTNTSANVLCCTFDFTAAEYQQLCGIQDIGSGWPRATNVAEYFSVGAPAFRSTAYDTYAGTQPCLANPGMLQTMAPIVLGAGRNLIPEQKVCDLLCQSKLIAANPDKLGSLGCVTGVYCQAMVNAWTDIIVGVLNKFTNNNNVNAASNPYQGQPWLTQPGGSPVGGWVLQTFELNVAKYIVKTYPMAVACFLYQLNGANLATTQADPYNGYYPSSFGMSVFNVKTGVTTALPTLGGLCPWCVNGSSVGGWADVFTAISSPGGNRITGGISIADVVVPQGALMVASTNAKAAAAQGMYFTPWTMERSSGTFGSVVSATWPPGSSGNLNQYMNSVGGYYLGHQGQSALDHEDMLFMLYALKYDVPNVIGVFSDYPATTTAFANCVPKMDATMPVSATSTWNTPPTPPPPTSPPPPSPLPPPPPKPPLPPSSSYLFNLIVSSANGQSANMLLVSSFAAFLIAMLV